MAKLMLGTYLLVPPRLGGDSWHRMVRGVRAEFPVEPTMEMILVSGGSSPGIYLVKLSASFQYCFSVNASNQISFHRAILGIISCWLGPRYW